MIRKLLIGSIILLFIGGGFMMGMFIGIEITGDTNIKSDQSAKSRTAEIKERTNQSLSEAMAMVTIEKKIEVKNQQGSIRIANAPESNYLAEVKILLDEDEREIYKTQIIDPGYYIETMTQESLLTEGFHSGTAVFTFYTKEEILLGTGAEKIVMIVKN